MSILVQKFGGSSVATPERIKVVAQRVVDASKAGDQVVTVVSAVGKTTDLLIAQAREISASPPRREMDMLLATGEQISIALLAMAIHELGHDVVSLTGPQAGISTDTVHTKARIQQIETSRLKSELDAGRIVIVAGFQGLNDNDDITTLGRGGSDTTAVGLAAALGAKVCEIFTDVDGVYTADPRIVKTARKLQDVSYGEMLEMASLGAVVLQPRSVELASLHGVDIQVRSSFNYNEGTYVREERVIEKDMVVVGAAHDTDVAKLVLVGVPDRPGVAATLFERLGEANVSADMIVQTNRGVGQTDILFTVSGDDLEPTRAIATALVEELGAESLQIDDAVAKVSIVGTGVANNPAVPARMFRALAERAINVEVIATSEIKISCLISQDQVEVAVRTIHDAFDLGG